MAAPIFDEKERILGSITLVGTMERFEAFNEAFLARLICKAAADISQRIARRERGQVPQAPLGTL
jgi:DNA-binding IclR family transcriptional regulator